MSRRPAAKHDATRAHLRRMLVATVPVGALAALAIGLPAAAHASSAKCANPGKSADHKPAGVGGGRRVR
jgi:hypothetical protein